MREYQEQLEARILSPLACLAKNSRGRQRDCEPCPRRTCFQRDRDRIIHCKSFRRLNHKTQVFISPEGDHYRDRLTHTLEVAQIARTIARSLRLNEDLTEAIALGHDLGHTPFGHSGERALNSLVPFRHNEHSLRVVDVLEREGEGLNLSWEVRDGIVCHTGSRKAQTLEGQLVHFADRIAYINHDVDDAIRAGVLTAQALPEEPLRVLGTSHGDRIDTMVADMAQFGLERGVIGMSEPVYLAMMQLRAFLFRHVYEKIDTSDRVRNVIDGLFSYFCGNPGELPPLYQTVAGRDGTERAVCDYIAGMTDRYATEQYIRLFVPEGWSIRGR